MMDTTDGILMAKASKWALRDPLGKVFYNVTCTGLSVAVALGIGSIEVVQVLMDRLSIRGALVDFVDAVNFRILGYGIVARS